jgi:hypothetical protein
VLACVEKSGELGWVVGCSLGGERWDGEEEGETEEERVLVEWVYTCVYRRNHRRNISIGITVGDSAGVSDTSLIGYPGLNTSVFPSVNSSEKNPRHDVVATFKKSFSPSVYTDGIIPSGYTDDIADGLFSSANTDSFWDGISSIVKNYRRKISVGNFVGVIRFFGSDKWKKKIYMKLS